MALGSARHQKPGQPGRAAQGTGEAGTGSGRDEARLARQGEEDSGQGLLAQVLSKANMVRAWKRVKANRGSAGVDGRGVASSLATASGEPGTMRSNARLPPRRSWPTKRAFVS